MTLQRANLCQDKPVLSGARAPLSFHFRTEVEDRDAGDKSPIRVRGTRQRHELRVFGYRPYLAGGCQRRLIPVEHAFLPPRLRVKSRSRPQSPPLAAEAHTLPSSDSEH